MTAPATRILIAALILGQVACVSIPIPGTRREPRVSEVGRNVHQGDELLGPAAFSSKPVTGKEPPHRLLARDGTACIVSREKFERTLLGTSVWCVWT
jgi:hypothetical protein